MGLTLLRVRRDSAECARSVRGERSGLGRRMQENARGVRRGCKEAASRGREDQVSGCRSGRRRDGDPGVPPPGQEAPGARSSPLPARVTLVPARPGQGFPHPRCPPGPGNAAGCPRRAALQLRRCSPGQGRAETPEARIAAPELWGQNR